MWAVCQDPSLPNRKSIFSFGGVLMVCEYCLYQDGRFDPERRALAFEESMFPYEVDVQLGPTNACIGFGVRDHRYAL